MVEGIVDSRVVETVEDAGDAIQAIVDAFKMQFGEEETVLLERSPRLIRELSLPIWLQVSAFMSYHEELGEEKTQLLGNLSPDVRNMTLRGRIEVSGLRSYLEGVVDVARHILPLSARTEAVFCELENREQEEGADT